MSDKHLLILPELPGGRPVKARSGVIPEHWPSRGASILAAMASGDEELGLRRVVPMAHRFSDGTWLVGVEVWDHGVVVRWAKSRPEPRVAHSPPSSTHGWLVSDDVETEYAQVGGHGGGRPSRPSRGEAEFEPAPPPEAISLTIRRDAVDDSVSVPLTD